MQPLSHNSELTPHLSFACFGEPASVLLNWMRRLKALSLLRVGQEERKEGSPAVSWRMKGLPPRGLKIGGPFSFGTPAGR